MHGVVPSLDIRKPGLRRVCKGLMNGIKRKNVQGYIGIGSR